MNNKILGTIYLTVAFLAFITSFHEIDSLYIYFDIYITGFLTCKGLDAFSK